MPVFANQSRLGSFMEPHLLCLFRDSSILVSILIYFRRHYPSFEGRGSWEKDSIGEANMTVACLLLGGQSDKSFQSNR